MYFVRLFCYALQSKKRGNFSSFYILFLPFLTTHTHTFPWANQLRRPVCWSSLSHRNGHKPDHKADFVTNFILLIVWKQKFMKHSWTLEQTMWFMVVTESKGLKVFQVPLNPSFLFCRKASKQLSSGDMLPPIRRECGKQLHGEKLQLFCAHSYPLMYYVILNEKPQGSDSCTLFHRL